MRERRAGHTISAFAIPLASGPDAQSVCSRATGHPGFAASGAGVTFGMEESFRPWIERGALLPVLEDYCPRFAGFSLYYPSRRNVAPKLRALVDHLQRFRCTPCSARALIMRAGLNATSSILGLE